MSNVVKLALAVAIIAVTAASASAATHHKPHANIAALRQLTRSTAFNLASVRLPVETGAFLIQSRGLSEGDVGVPYIRN